MGQVDRRPFHVELIKPFHYDDDGYVFQWIKAWIAGQIPGNPRRADIGG
jgi:hypothetical protein